MAGKTTGYFVLIHSSMKLVVAASRINLSSSKRDGKCRIFDKNAISAPKSYHPVHIYWRCRIIRSSIGVTRCKQQ